MQASPFRERLEHEFHVCREQNARYSLRAFAKFLGTDHSTLSQILRRSRRVPLRGIRAWGKKLGISQEEIAVYVAAEHVQDASTLGRLEQLRHWTAEAMAIVGDGVHWRVLQLTRERGFLPDCRKIAAQLDVTVDEVNVALSRLLRLQFLRIQKSGRWEDLSGKKCTEQEFRKLALQRVKEKAAENQIKLRA